MCHPVPCLQAGGSQRQSGRQISVIELLYRSTARLSCISLGFSQSIIGIAHRSCDGRVTVADHEPWNKDSAQAIITAGAGREGAALPILHALQAEFGFVPREAIPMIAAALNITRAEMHGIVTFYHDFRDHPPGRHVLRLCRAEACQAMGGDALGAYARDALGVDWHGTTSDGAVTLEPVFCLGLCAIGPAGMLDGKPLGRLDEAGVDTALADAV
jgi:formate dehydrogenase subunit gamma